VRTTNVAQYVRVSVCLRCFAIPITGLWWTRCCKAYIKFVGSLLEVKNEYSLTSTSPLWLHGVLEVTLCVGMQRRGQTTKSHIV